MKILFVCTGNTCRSPMAQKLAEKYLPGECEIFSAGIHAIANEQASSQAVEVLKEKGIDLSGHRAVQLSEEMLAAADYVFTMTRSQEAYLGNLFPQYREKIKALGPWLGSGGDILDPWGGSLEIYRSCLKELEAMIRALALRLEDS
ncbi:MAG TPA: low molecular weight protein arginine phosphatase [Peptococcaceae bacterium]|nr:low molecular weight protein arginine phosphatase [Peptococcaceae bacterium]